MGDNSPDTLKIIRDPTTIKSRIFIGNMPTNGTDKKDIDEIFSKYGKITAISMNRGFTFVQFDNESSASEAIKKEAGRMLQNKKLDIKHALRGKQKSPDQGRERSPIGDKWSGGGMDDSDRRIRGARDWGSDWKDRFDVGFGPRGRPGIDEPFPPTEYPLGNTPFKAVAADYPPPANIAQVDRTNDCEIIVVNKAITEYAEYIELRLKKVGLTVDLLFPNEDVPLGRVLANISGRGSLYAIVVTPQNEEHRSLTVNILHGQHQEHRNMPMEDAISLITRNFDLYMRGERSGGSALGTPVERHPEAIQTLLNLLQQNRQLTVLQYDKVIRYLQEKREVQVKFEVGDAKDLPALMSNKDITPAKQTELQNRIMNILNKTGGANNADTPSPVPAPGRWSGGHTPSVTGGHTTHSTGPGTNSGGPPPLLNDPTVQKALDNLIQGDLLRKITPGSVPAPVPAPQPLFGAYGQGRKY